MEEHGYDTDTYFNLDLGDVGYNFGELILNYQLYDDLNNNIYNNNNNYDDENNMDGLDTINGLIMESSKEKFKSGSLAQRRAAKLGFDDSRIHGANLKIESPFSSLTSSSLSSSSSSLFTSPTALLDSPVMLHNAQSSPTTGTLPLESFYHDPLPVKLTDIPRTEKADDEKDKGSKIANIFFFTSSATTQIQENDNHQYSKIEADYKRSSRSPKSEVHRIQDASSTDDHIDREVDMNKKPCKKKEVRYLQPAKMVIGDGFCWRKYGQKNVKGSPFPRSYYKCNDPVCLAKKKVGKRLDGLVVEIIYKGEHNHPKPKDCNNRGCQALSISDYWSDVPEDQIATTGQENSVFGYESFDQFSSENESRVGEGNECDPEGRNMELMYPSEVDMPSRSAREQRIIIRIISETDVMDDGYRWRKYGQKVVKGSQYPRNYYKCTSPKCQVRKHVERESGDNNIYVLTTYEGKHNHEVQTAKTNATATTSSSRTNNLVGNSSAGSNLPPHHHNPILGIPQNPNHHHNPILGIPQDPNHHHSILPNLQFKLQELSLQHQHQHQQMMLPNNKFTHPPNLFPGQYSPQLYHEMVKHPPPPPPPPPYMINPNPNSNVNGIMNQTSSCLFMPPMTMQAPLSIQRSAAAASASSIYNNGIFSWIGTNSSSSSAAQPQTFVRNDLYLNENNNDLGFFKPKEEQ